VYDAKEAGFLPGGASLHNCMSGHGPDFATFEKASRSNTSQPEYITGTMAFMFETRSVIVPTSAALGLPELQHDYAQCWSGLSKYFSPDLAQSA
jgi:homogentisate 1,2-dioxygenase